MPAYRSGLFCRLLEIRRRNLLYGTETNINQQTEMEEFYGAQTGP